jgi:hypothetical protein
MNRETIWYCNGPRLLFQCITGTSWLHSYYITISMSNVQNGTLHDFCGFIKATPKLIFSCSDMNIHA